MDFSKIKMINAGAGSGKTYRITELLFDAVEKNGVKPSEIFATTFTNKAAAELVQRVRTKFLEKVSESDRAKDNALLINEARIGTLHSLCAEYLKRFAFDLGLSPEVEVLEESGAADLFRHAIDEEDADTIKELSRLGRKLSMAGDGYSDHPLDYVKKIANEATANGIAAKDLEQMGERSWQLYNQLLDEACGKVDDNLTLSNIGKVVDRCLADTSQIPSKTQSQKNFIALIKKLELKPWATNWSAIESIKVPRNNDVEAHFSPFIELTERLGQFAQFRNDIESFIKLSYEIAANSMTRYRDLKNSRGVLDFSDLECQFLALLDKPAVQAILAAELKLLMVDEFQDTNPMQLAIYLKLTNLVEQSIFVGDLKQAIYGFRGSDPELMVALQKTLEEQGIKTEKLDISRRSTQAIVEHSNKVFSPIFGEEETHLKVWDKLEWQPSCGSPELFSFSQKGKNLKIRNQGFAERLKQFVDSGPSVLDKETETERKMLWNDIGILTKTNDDAKDLAKALTDAGIPAQCEQPGLLEEPEVVLARALMSLSYGSDNRIAYAEIRSIIKNQAVDDWLEDLLEDTAKPSRLLGEALISKIESLRAISQQVAPSEVLTTAIATFSLVDIIRRWDDNEFSTQQRIANLDALFKLVQAYEQHATSLGLPVTLAGLNQFLSQKSKDKSDLKGISTGRAVAVMTIHRAKGLEWPCVILACMEKKPNDRLFGVSVQSSSRGFSIDAPLKDRWIQFLPPYSSEQSKGTVKRSLQSTNVGQQKQAIADEESHRLLYVAFTRARNYLSVIEPGEPKEGTYKALLNEEAYSFPDVTANWPQAETVEQVTQMPFVVPSPKELKPRYIQPSTSIVEAQVVVGESLQYGAPLTLSGALNTAKLGETVHQLIGFILLNPEEDASNMAVTLLAPFTSDKQKVKQLTEQARHFVAKIRERFKPDSVWVEMPITALSGDNQTIKGSIDLLLETSNGLVVIDHKLKGAGTAEKQHELANRYGDQLVTYKKALELNGYTVQALVLNAFSSGTLVNVKAHSACDS